MGDVADIDRNGRRSTCRRRTCTTISGKRDDHLVPFAGGINWNVAMMSMQKVGYDGTYLMELANTGSPASVLRAGAGGARSGFERAAHLLRRWRGTADDAYIEDIARHDGQPVRLRGWLHNRRSSGKIHFLTVRDGIGLHPVRDVEGRRSAKRCSRRADHLSQESAVVVDGTVRADARAPAATSST